MKRTNAQARKKVRKHLERYGNQTDFVITQRLVMHWWSALNQAVFDGKLPKPVEIVVKLVKGAYAESLPTNSDNVSIYIDSELKDREFFITVLVHEMVHQYEMVHYGEMTHGPKFYEWKEIIEERVGVKLMRDY